MDRERPRKSFAQRWGATGIRVALVPIGLIALYTLLRAWLGPGVAREDIRTSVAEVTPIEATIRATGNLIPEIEVTLSSPIAAPIASIRVEAGQRVERGTVLLELHTTREQVALDNLDEQIALKATELKTLEILVEETLAEREGRRQLAEVDLESAKAKLARMQRLTEVGAISGDELKEAELDVRRVEIEIDQAERNLETQRRRHLADVDRIELERSILEKQRDEQARRIELATVRAPRSGLLTWIESRDGLSVVEGQPLARVASEEGFRVAAVVSDFYTPQLSEGLRARVTSTSGETFGTLVGILPSSETNNLALAIELDDPATSWLRSNLRIEAEIITARQDSAITVRRGPSVNQTGFQEVYVIMGSEALLRRVELGMASRDRIEIVAGLEPGDEIIISDMTKFRDKNRIRVR